MTGLSVDMLDIAQGLGDLKIRISLSVGCLGV